MSMQDEMDRLEKEERSAVARRFRGFLPVIVDLETGGFNSSTDAILEMAATTIKMDENGKIIADESRSYHVEPFPGANLEPAALEFTGIDPYHPFREAVKEVTALGEMLKFVRQKVKQHGCNRAILVGHNAHFDLGFMLAAVERHGIKRNPFHPFSVLDTASLSALAYGHTVLAKSCQIAGIDFNSHEAHSAEYDTGKTTELFCDIFNRWQDLGGWPLPKGNDADE